MRKTYTNILILMLLFILGDYPVDAMQNSTLSNTGNYISDNLFKVYPNPAQDILYVEFSVSLDKNSKIEIFSTIGLKVWESDGDLSHLTGKSISVEHLEKGMYFMVIKNDDKNYTRKIIKN